MGASQSGARPCADGCFSFASRGRKRRILLTGASGLLGRQVLAHLKTKYEIRGLYQSRKLENMVYADLLGDGEIEHQFTDFQPEVVIHCAAERRPDVVTLLPDKAKMLNVDVTEHLAKQCNLHKCWLINISTDYVFDGESPPFLFDTATHPLSAYGEQKVLGEKACKEFCPSAATVRVPLLFGPMEYVKETSVTQIYLDLRKKENFQPDHICKRYPTYTCDVARVIGKMVEAHFAGKRISGIYHWQADETKPFTKYDMAIEIAKLFELDTTNIQPGLVDYSAQRGFSLPKNNQMDCSRLINDLGIDANDYRTPFPEALKKTFDTFPRDAVVGDIVAKMDPCIKAGVDKVQLVRTLDKMGISICNQEIQKLMNKNGLISKGDYDEFLAHFPIDGL